MFSCFRGNKKDDDDDDEPVIGNGALLLEKSVAFNDGRGNPIRCFPLKEVQAAATHRAKCDRMYTFYNGFLHQEDRPVVVKLPGSIISTMFRREEFINEIVVASGMSSHKYALKLLGCCLESEIPILVFEHANMGSTLKDCIHGNGRADFQPLSWKKRLKIAVDIANVIAYLHTAFSRPVIHRDINPSNILIDEDYVPKLYDFFSSISIPEGETYIKRGSDEVSEVFFPNGYFAPEILRSGMYNEMVDVYSFGVMLLELFTAKKTHDILQIDVDETHDNIENYDYMVPAVRKYGAQRLGDLIDPVIVEEGTWPEKEYQLKAFLTLAIRCTSYFHEDRPEMIEVGKQLTLMYESFTSGN